MNASKENARVALEELKKIADRLPNRAAVEMEGVVQSVRQFLEVAERKLPREASFKKAKKAMAR